MAKTTAGKYDSGFDMMKAVLIKEGVDDATATSIATANQAACDAELANQVDVAKGLFGLAAAQAIVSGMETWAKTLAP